MRTELIIATYNKPKYLRVVLQSVLDQTQPPHSICIADDGSGSDTQGVIQAFQTAHPDLAVRHVWHPDQGFEKNKILNDAVRSSPQDHLVFIDDDCVMHPSFLARHIALAHPGRFMAGSVIRLDAPTTQRVLDQGRAHWGGDGVLAGWTPQSWSQRLKAGRAGARISAMLDRVSPVKKNWAGGNASAYRSAIVAVAGFDETLKYGGEDKEFGARLQNAGLRGRHLRYSAPLYHLDHGRGYVDRGVVAANRARIAQVRRDKITVTPHGLTPPNQALSDAGRS